MTGLSGRLLSNGTSKLGRRVEGDDSLQLGFGEGSRRGERATAAGEGTKGDARRGRSSVPLWSDSRWDESKKVSSAPGDGGSDQTETEERGRSKAVSMEGSRTRSTRVGWSVGLS